MDEEKVIYIHIYIYICIYKMKYYSALKKNEIMSFPGEWMELENIMLSKVSQAQKVKGHSGS
jgi:hypothetical protein